MQKSFVILTEKAADGSYSGLVPAAPGLLLVGATEQEILDDAPEAIKFHLMEDLPKAPDFAAHTVQIDTEDEFISGDYLNKVLDARQKAQENEENEEKEVKS